MVIPGQESFLLEVQSSALKLELLKSLEITWVEGRPVTGSNEASQKVSDKDYILI